MNKLSIIKCKNCGEEIELTDALTHQIREQITSEISVSVKKEVEEKSLLELEDLKKQLAQKEEKVAEFREKELELRDEKRKIEEEKKELKLTVQRQIDEERKKIEEKVYLEAQEKQRFKDLEKDKLIDDLKRSLEDAQRKASKTSQQLQGEVMELDLEEQLSKSFPNDEIKEVAKGARGADVLQKVRNKFGKTAGLILWEAKRAKWSPSWLSKLREDARGVSANVSVLISEELPKDVATFQFVENVLVCSYQYVIPLATLLRRELMLIAQAKMVASNKDATVEKLYSYLQSEIFRHRFEAYVEGIVEMQEDLETERRSSLRLWKKREIQINRALENISNMYGEFQGIMGSSLADIKLLSIESGEKEEEST